MAHIKHIALPEERRLLGVDDHKAVSPPRQLGGELGLDRGDPGLFFAIVAVAHGRACEDTTKQGALSSDPDGGASDGAPKVGEQRRRGDEHTVNPVEGAPENGVIGVDR
jgi:hypothetical protein